MSIFRFEMKQYKRSIIVWSIALSATILFLLPVFMSLVTEDSASLSSLLEGNAMTEALGVDAENFFSTLGIYAYLNSFILLAGAIHAINLGLSVITKEHMQNTADFLMTKPYTRTQVYLSKLGASCCSILIIGGCYFVASLGVVSMAADADFSFTIFFQLYLMFPLVQFFFLLLGMAIGVIISRIGSTLPLSMGIAFGLYVLGMFSNVVKSNVARAFSPFKYFNSNTIMASGGYDFGYLVLYLALLTILIASGYILFTKKDYKMVL